MPSIEVKKGRQTKIWEYLLGHNGWRLEKRRDEVIAELFPNYHDYSLRDFLAKFLDEEKARKMPHVIKSHDYSDLFRLHPRAIHLLLVYGKHYIPKRFNSPMPEPENDGCFRNSLQMMMSSHVNGNDSEKLFYVEGVAVGPLIRPMLHAWNSPVDRRWGINVAIDWTLFSFAHWNKYFGVALTFDEFNGMAKILHPESDELCSLPLLNRKNFPLIEGRMIEVLEARNRKN